MSAVLLCVEGALATITLNRPAKLNAIDAALAGALAEAVLRVADEPDVRLVLVRGAGRSFCAGIDRDMLADGELPSGFFELSERARLGLEGMDKITVAELHGHCLGGGVQLAIACDIRIAATDCRLALPAVSDGIIPGMAPIRLPRLIGLGPARRLMLTGEVIGAEEALRLGLVDHVVPAADRAAAVEQVLATISPPPARPPSRSNACSSARSTRPSPRSPHPARRCSTSAWPRPTSRPPAPNGVGAARR